MIAEQVNISAQSQNFDLDMELLNPAKIRTVGAKSVKIIGTEKNRKHAVSMRVLMQTQTLKKPWINFGKERCTREDILVNFWSNNLNFILQN